MRHWKTFSTSFATLGARLTVVASILIINGVATRRMTHDQFGLWAILYSLNLLTNGLDLGFSFTLGNRLAALGSRGAEGEAERRETFLAIFFLQAAIAAAFILIVLLLFPVLPWAHLFKITDPLLVAQMNHLMPVITAVMIGTLPISLMWTVFFAYHEIKLASVLAGIANILQICIFVAAAYCCKFTWVIFIYFVTNIVLGVALTIYVFIRRQWKFDFIPLRQIIAVTRSMARVSFHAFLLNLAPIISNILGPFVSGATAGLGAAGDFNLVQKLFSLLISSHLGLMAPFAPKITLEAQSGDWDALRRRLRLCLLQLWPAIFVGLGGVIWCAHPLLIRLWAGKWLHAYPLATLLLIWACLTGLINTFGVVLNALGLVKIQAAVSFTMLIPSMLLPALLGRWLGLPGIALSMVLCVVPAAIIWPIYTRRALRLQLRRV